MELKEMVQYLPILVLTFASGGTLYAQDEKIQNLEQAIIRQVEIRDQVIRLEVKQEMLAAKLDTFIVDQKSRWKDEDRTRVLLERFLVSRTPN